MIATPEKNTFWYRLLPQNRWGKKEKTRKPKVVPLVAWESRYRTEKKKLSPGAGQKTPGPQRREKEKRTQKPRRDSEKKGKGYCLLGERANDGGKRVSIHSSKRPLRAREKQKSRRGGKKGGGINDFDCGKFP